MGTWIVGILFAGLLGLAARSVIRRAKSGGCGCSGCSSCSDASVKSCCK